MVRNDTPKNFIYEQLVGHILFRTGPIHTVKGLRSLQNVIKPKSTLLSSASVAWKIISKKAGKIVPISIAESVITILHERV